MHDWNGNGQFDPADSFIDYQVYKDVMKPGRQKPSGSGCLTSAISTVLSVGFVIVMLIVCN
ncbi:MAG: hypothetical protein IKD96_00345 [Oscillospiraceae bacterium]|nr:hypothetical protein [Oscillospiraceae bacterium]